MYKFVFATVGTFLRILFRVVFRWRITGLENIPVGGAVLSPNHLSFWDIPLIALAVPRRVHFMAKEELFRIPVFGFIIRSLLAFPVKRGAPDRNAIRYAIEKLQEGDIVLVFPEGTRSKTGKLGEFKPGAFLIAVKAGAPTIPAVIIGTNRMLRSSGPFPRIEIQFGAPVLIEGAGDSDSKNSVGEIGRLVRLAIEKIMNKKP